MNINKSGMKNNSPDSSKDIVHNVKVGSFQLQTKSFWLTLVSLLTAFIFFFCYANISLYYKLSKEVMEHDEKLLDEIIKVVVQTRISEAKEQYQSSSH